MDQFETIFLGLWFLLLVAILGYWGNLAWFHPEKFMQRHTQDEGGRNRLLLMRIVTLIGALSILYLGILFLLSLQGI